MARLAGPVVVAPLLLAAAFASPLAGLEPASIWEHFGRLLATPRCSGNEAAAAQLVRDVAARQGLEAVQDHARNIIVKRPASGAAARAGADAVIIQTHLDMVCEKNTGLDHDWTKDPVRTVLRDGWLVAADTTLGADNGIGVATALALMSLDREETLPPLELVFTVEEETGLFGAEKLEVSRLSGTRLINLDSEEYGFVYIGCAGGGDATVSLPVTSAPVAAGHEAYRLALTGLRGGHSGADIHEDRANALLLLARAVSRLLAQLPGSRLLEFAGGDKDNAIPREATAVVAMAAADLAAARRELAAAERDLRLEYGRIDPGLALALAAEPMPSPPPAPLDAESAGRLLDLLTLLPYGPQKRSHEMANFMVETSNNVAAVLRESPTLLKLVLFPRSSLSPALEEVQRRIATAASRVGGTVRRTYTFPGWAPNSSQPLVAMTVEEVRKATGAAPEVLSIHAGLECGVIGSKMPGLEMVSFGPDIVGAHAPGERVRVSSVEGNWAILRNLLRRLAGSAGQEL